MPIIRLLRIDPALADTLSQGAEDFEASFGVRLGEVAPVVQEILAPSLGLAAAAGPPWGAYLAADADSQQIVGTCAFKSAPSAEGIVEIAYFTFPPFEGQGYATAMARQLVDLAQAEPAVTRVIAHTLPEQNASARLLQKIGMRFMGEVYDPEDGRVWRWEQPRET